MARPVLEIALDSKEVLAGELIEGALVVSTDQEVVVSEVQVALEGEERTTVRSSRPSPDRLILPSLGYVGERRKIPGVERTVVGESRLEPPNPRIPFSLRVPIDVLPSHAGRFSSITWILKARITVVPPPDLLQMAQLKVVSRGRDNERRVAATPEGVAVGLGLDVKGGRVEPQAHISGSVTIGEVKRKVREVRVELLSHEVARAGSGRWQQIEVKDTLLVRKRVFGREEIAVGARKAFVLEAPRDLPPMYRGKWSSVDILLRAIADVSFRPNVSVTVSLGPGRTPSAPRSVNSPRYPSGL